MQRDGILQRAGVEATVSRPTCRLVVFTWILLTVLLLVWLIRPSG